MRIVYPLVLTTSLLLPAAPALAEEFKTVKPSTIMEEVVTPAAKPAVGKPAAVKDAKATKDAAALKGKMLDQKVNQYFQQGMIYQSMGAPAHAIKFYEQAMKEDPAFVSTYNNLAQCLIARNEEGDKTRALNLLAQAVKLDPNNVGTVHAFAVLKEENKDYAAAEEAYGKVLKIQPLNMRAIQNLSEMHFRLGHKDKAKLVLMEALKHNPPEQEATIFKQALANLDKQPLPPKDDAKQVGTADGAAKQTASKE